MSLHSLFESAGLSDYLAIFIENDIDLDTFAELTEDDLEKIGIDKLGARKKILKLIASLRSQEANSATKTNRGTEGSGTSPFGNAAQANLTVRGFQEGMLFDQERYVLVSRLGRGAFGEVWKAKDKVGSPESQDVFVAVKLIPPDISRTPREIEGIKKNYALVERLVHQHIAALKGLIQDGDDTLLLMECVDGCDLVDYRKQYIEKHGFFPESEAIRIGMQIAQALDYAHSRKVLHRDIKPENIMITTSGDVKVLDFGLAAEIQSSMNRVSMAVTDTSGTRPYMSPEQWQGRPQGQASDQYSLAVLLYEILCGELPFVCDDTAILKECVLREPPKQKKGISNNVWRSLQVGLSKKESDRHERCIDLLQPLTDINRNGDVQREVNQKKDSVYIAEYDSEINPIIESKNEFSIESLYNEWRDLPLGSKWNIARVGRIQLSATLYGRHRRSISLLVSGSESEPNSSSSSEFKEELRISLVGDSIRFNNQPQYDVPLAFQVTFTNSYLTTNQINNATEQVINSYSDWIKVVMPKISIHNLLLPRYLTNFKDRRARISPLSNDSKGILNGLLLWRYQIYKLCSKKAKMAASPFQAGKKEDLMKTENAYALTHCNQPLRSKIKKVLAGLKTEFLTDSQIDEYINEVKKYLLDEIFKVASTDHLQQGLQKAYNAFCIDDVFLRYSVDKIEDAMNGKEEFERILTYGESDIRTNKLRSICYYSTNDLKNDFLLEIRPAFDYYYIWISNFRLSLAFSSSEEKVLTNKKKIDKFAEEWWCTFFNNSGIELDRRNNHFDGSVSLTGKNDLRAGGTCFRIKEVIKIRPNNRIPSYDHLRGFFDGFAQFLSEFSDFLSLSAC